MGALPSFKDWLKTFWLLILLGLWVEFLRWTDESQFFSINLPVLIVHAISMGTFFPVAYLAYVHYVLWGKHEGKKLPAWFPSKPSWDEAVWQYLSALSAAMAAITPFLLLVTVGLVLGAIPERQASEIVELIAQSEVFQVHAVGSTTFTLALIHRWQRRDEERKAAKAREKQAKEKPHQ